MSKLFVVPVDGSDQSRKALDLSIDLARYYDACLHLVYVTQPLMTEDIFAMGTLAIPVDLPQDELEQYGRRVLEKAQAIALDLGVTQSLCKILSGDPAGSIVDYAKEITADMSIIGSRGLGDFSSLLMGSVSRKVAHDSPCTCITVK